MALPLCLRCAFAGTSRLNDLEEEVEGILSAISLFLHTQTSKFRDRTHDDPPEADSSMAAIH
ncbi:MAG: hypothetical protein ACXW4B_06155 [Micavibrio sp.]